MKLHQGTRPNSSSVTPTRSRRRVDDPEWGRGWLEYAACKNACPLDFTFEGTVTFANIEAVRMCDRCLVEQRCYDDMAERPADHRAEHVAGGFIWNSAGNPRRPKGLSSVAAFQRTTEKGH